MNMREQKPIFHVNETKFTDMSDTLFSKFSGSYYPINLDINGNLPLTGSCQIFAMTADVQMMLRICIRT